MDEDYVASPAADVEVEGPSSPPKENNTASTSLSSHPNMAAAFSAPNDNASDGLNASMHARTTTPASPLNANDFQAAAAPNSAPETLKNFTTNKALIDAVNNTFLEMYESYTGKARMTGSGDAKCLVIHFQSKEACDACVGAAHQQFPDLVFHAHDSKQLRSDEDLRAIQVTDIPFFLTKDNIMSYFKKFRYISLLSSLLQEKCQIDQKSSRRAFVATLTQLPPNTKDIDLAPLTKRFGAKAVNVPLSLNSYKPKRWAYVTFNSQETMDAAMEQIIGSRSRSRSKGPGNSQSSQPQKPLANTRLNNNPRRDRSKSNDKRDRSVSFSTVVRSPPPLSTPNQATTMSPHEAANILSLLKSLQQDMADTSEMLIDAPAIPAPTVKQVSPRPAVSPVQRTLNPLSPGFIPSRPVRGPISAPVDIPDISSLSSTSHMAPPSTQTHDEIQAINAKHSAIENKLDMLANSISGFIGSIASSSYSSDSADKAGSN
ncbi:hypothetical protein RclHR1_23770002 [Rhizophagus clarus]|uniref:RRM domain-containing protein n=1 Tax=Rhizophagus clarus TaxID=94130 RepID=A0A2Z6QW43_9GLOM|nr:hypothetical protein RclHR1_23770002 [Rhizophagus clarus]